MKKPNVLNRAMFNRGGTSAYGKGITSNLVSDEQRQRFNYGGRVKLQYGTPWKDFGWSKDPALQFQYAPYPGGPGPKRNPSGAPMKDWWDTQRAKWNLREMKDYADENVEVGDDLESQDPYQGSDPRYFKPKFTQEDWGTSDLETPGDVPVIEEKEKEVITKSPHGDEMWNETIVRDDTDELDTPDRWAFLDENIEKKKKLARGHALMEGAAAAMDCGTAPTPEKKGAAISKGLRGVGTIGSKYKGEAEDIKNKAKILGTIEDIKGERKEKQFEKQLEGYYKPIIDIRKEELALKKEAAALKAEGASNKDVYVALSNAGKLNNPTAKADLLSSFIGKQIQMAANPKEVKQLSTPENDGVIFMDSKGRLWRNTKGDVAVIDIWQDTEFFGK